LWNFETHEYHRWVQEEGMMEKFPPITGSNATQTIRYRSSKLLVGPGLHDSSAALIPYLATTKEPFVLISTGTWSISLNPFNDSTLTLEELREDCLCYISFQGKSVKSSRLFAGHEHDAVTRELSTHFKKPLDYFQTISTAPTNPLPPWTRPEDFPSYESAYGSFMNYLVQQQVRSTQLVLHHSDVKSIFVDGGFSSNFLFMTNLAKAFPDKAVYTTSLHQASTVGAAMAIHDSWNKKPIASSVLSLIRITA
jgi:sugar (pentulose or hexulose) kinase